MMVLNHHLTVMCLYVWCHVGTRSFHVAYINLIYKCWQPYCRNSSRDLWYPVLTVYIHGPDMGNGHQRASFPGYMGTLQPLILLLQGNIFV